MSAETPSQGRGGSPAGRSDLPRAVLLVLGAALAAFGAQVRARTALRIAPRIDPSSLAGTTAAVIITATAGALVVTASYALVQRRRRGRRRNELPRAAPPLPGTPLTRFLVGLTAVALMLAPVAAVIVAAAQQGRDASITVPAGPIGAPPSGGRPHSAEHAAAPLDTAGRDVALLVAAGVLVGAASWRVLRPRRAGPTGLADPAVAEAQLAAAVKAATRALQEAPVGDPRQAVIDCYSAMEQSLTTTLTLRRPTDTPQELLRRARGIGVLHGEDAERLTALFERARFSHRPLDENDRAAAAQALVRVQRELTV